MLALRMRRDSCMDQIPREEERQGGGSFDGHIAIGKPFLNLISQGMVSKNQSSTNRKKMSHVRITYRPSETRCESAEARCTTLALPERRICQAVRKHPRTCGGTCFICPAPPVFRLF